MPLFHSSNKRIGIISCFIIFLVFILIPNISATTNVTTCQSLNVSNELYVLQNDLYVNSLNCWSFNAENITFDCNWHTITVDPKDTWELISSNASSIQNCIIVVNSTNWTASVIHHNFISNGSITLKNINLTLDAFIDCGGGYPTHNCADPIFLWGYENNYLENITINDYTHSNGSGWRGNYIFVWNNHSGSVNADGIYLYADTDTIEYNRVFINFDSIDNVTATNLHAELNSSYTGNYYPTAFLFHHHNFVNISNAYGYFDENEDSAQLLYVFNVSSANITNVDVYGEGKDTGRALMVWGYPDNMTISDITCSNTKYCIVDAHTDGGTIILDDIKSNLTSGEDILLWGNDTIVRNSILNSTYPIMAYDLPAYGKYPQDNLIYNNYFLHGISPANISNRNYWNTTRQAGTNIIGGSYIGGNFYGDYSGCDSDNDGIGETVYQIDSNNIDYLPLTNSMCSTIEIVEKCTPEIIRMCEPYDEWTSAICLDNNTLRKTKECVLTWTENSTDYRCTWVKTEDQICDNGCYDNISPIGSGCAPTNLEILYTTGIIFVVFVILSSLIMEHKIRRRR